MATIAADTQQLFTANASLLAVSTLEKDIASMEAVVANTILAQGGSDRMVEEMSVAKEVQNEWDQTLQALLQMVDDDEDEKYVAELQAHAAKWYRVMDETLQLANTDQDMEAEQTFEAGEPELSALEEHLLDHLHSLPSVNRPDTWQTRRSSS